MAKIRNSQDLRDMLFETIDLLKQGKILYQDADAIAKLSAVALKSAIEEAKYRQPGNVAVEFFEEIDEAAPQLAINENGGNTLSSPTSPEPD